MKRSEEYNFLSQLGNKELALKDRIYRQLLNQDVNAAGTPVEWKVSRLMSPADIEQTKIILNVQRGQHPYWL